MFLELNDAVRRSIDLEPWSLTMLWYISRFKHTLSRIRLSFQTTQHYTTKQNGVTIHVNAANRKLSMHTTWPRVSLIITRLLCIESCFPTSRMFIWVFDQRVLFSGNATTFSLLNSIHEMSWAKKCRDHDSWLIADLDLGKIIPMLRSTRSFRGVFWTKPNTELTR